MRGHLKKRGKRGWWLVLDDKDAGGQRKRRWINLNRPGQPPKVRTKKEADEEAGRIVQELREGTYGASKNLTVSEHLKRWLEHHSSNVQSRSLERYATVIRKYISPALGSVLLRDLRPKHIQEFYDRARARGVTSGVVRYCHITLHAALKHAMQIELISRNAADAVKKPKAQKASVRALTDDELGRVLLAVEGTDLEVPVYLSATCGLRRGEALALRWSAVDFDSARLQVRETLEKRRQGVEFKLPKTDKSRRTVSIPSTTLTLLRRFRTAQIEKRLAKGPQYDDHDLIVSQANGYPMDPEALSKAFTKLARSLKMGDVHFHCLRHTAATTMLARGIHPKVVQECLGHSSIAITMDTYSHVAPTMQDEAARQIDTALRVVIGQNATVLEKR